MYPELTADVTGGIARFKPIRLDLLARDAICAAEARGAITKAVSDGDMTDEDAGTLGGLLKQSAAKLQHAVTELSEACGKFD